MPIGLSSQSEFTEEFTFEFGGETDSITGVAALALINNIQQANAPETEFTQNSIRLHFKSEDTGTYEKGLLETELLIEYTKDGQELKAIKKIAIAWIKNAHTALV